MDDGLSVNHSPMVPDDASGAETCLFVCARKSLHEVVNLEDCRRSDLFRTCGAAAITFPLRVIDISHTQWHFSRSHTHYPTHTLSHSLTLRPRH